MFYLRFVIERQRNNRKDDFCLWSKHPPMGIGREVLYLQFQNLKFFAKDVGRNQDRSWDARKSF